MDVEARFLHADTLIERGEVAEAKAILEEILQDEPDYGRAHNHLGWIIRTRFSDFDKAEYHMRLAVKFAPEYPGAHFNYARILMEIGAYDKLIDVAQNALKVKGIEKAYLYHFLAVGKEMTVGPQEAIKYLKRARDEALSEEFTTFINSELRRVKSKMTTLSRIAIMF